VPFTTTLERIETVVDASGQAPVIEARLPGGGRPRQLSVRTLLVGTVLAVAHDRPLQLVRVHQALVHLGAHDRRRLGIDVTLARGPAPTHLSTGGENLLARLCPDGPEPGAVVRLGGTRTTCRPSG
jgi:hypothetical protein